MRIWKLLCCLALGALALVVVGALVVGLASRDVATSARAQGGANMVLDMNPNNGSGPCSPVDDTVTVGQGDNYDVAVCLTGATNPPNSFDVSIDHTDSIDQCIPTDCPDARCLDSNPDANTGNTTFSTPSLGTTGWDCAVVDINPPSCKNAGSQIYLECINVVQAGTLPVSPDVSAPLAIIHFTAASQGTDQLTISMSAAADWQMQEMVLCSVDIGSCRGGTVIVGAPGSVPTNPPTNTPIGTPAPGVTPPTVSPLGATATAAAVAPAATASAAAVATAIAQGTPLASINATATAASAATKAPVATKATAAATPTAKPSTTQQNTGGSSGPNAGLIAGIVVVALIVVGGAGWFTFRRLRSRRA